MILLGFDWLIGVSKFSACWMACDLVVGFTFCFRVYVLFYELSL